MTNPIDINGLVGRLRGPIKHHLQSVALRTEAADALETLERDNRDLVQHCVGRREAAQMWQERAKAAESSLAKLEVVVEAARQEVASGMCQSARLIEAIATLEAAHD